MRPLVRAGRFWLGLAAISWVCGSPATAWAFGNGSSGGSSGGSHGSSGGYSGGYHSHGSSGGSSGGNHSHGSSGGSSGGYHSHGSSGGSSGGQSGNGSSPTPSASNSSSAAVRLTIIVPAEAKLFIEDQPTQLTGTRRDFISPRLAPGQMFQYTLKAEVERANQKITGTEQFDVKAGDKVVVEFGLSSQNPELLVSNHR